MGNWETALTVFVVIELVGNIIYSLWIHRQIMHKYWELHPVLTHLFRFYLWLKTGFGHWPNWQKHVAAVHRKHHRYSDEYIDATRYDPISFRLHGTKKILFVDIKPHSAHWISEDDIQKFAFDIPANNSWLEKNLYCHKHLGKVIFGITMTLLFGYPGVIYGVLNFLFINYYEIFMSTIWVHKFGRVPKNRPNSNLDSSRNSFPYGCFLFGEELHSNHHDDVLSSNFAKKWYEIDLTFCLAKFLSWIGLLKFNQSKINLVS